MDWSRAKTILIISFACLNALLAYQLYATWTDRNEDNVVSTRTVEELNQLLAAHQIHLEDTLPMDLQKMAYVQVRVERDDNSWHSLSPAVDATSDRSRQKVEVELKKQIPSLSGYEFAILEGSRGEWRYYQLVDQYPVYAAPLAIKHVDQQLTAFRQIKVQVLSKEQPNVVISAHAAFKTAVEEGFVPHGATVKQVRLGYIGQLAEGDKQFLVPVWRFLVDGREPTFVNAVTGSIETEHLQ